ncbi:hypothetical protein LSCM1_02958 [Leishmania martiniquensis]|uniref:Uncharacterized protein n=1 Tax=Leishmania martiniquensis TaxID=1580590 RepID=A0A836KUZ0_9TRYP|nr:hypothetical protein LSCM1_02958 [Leishmania martiniquensis]
MALSYHVVLPLFLLFAFADLVLLSVRTLVSQRYHSLTLCYALMAVQESLLAFELLAVMGQVLSTCLVRAGMWAHTASLLSAFAPLWLLRTFLTAFAVLYKNSLIPRSSSAEASASAGVWAYLSNSTRAWRARGYGAVVSLDIVCCCLYYLSAVYVLGYVSEKTLYVPYHRRRWRHTQRKRSLATAAATTVVSEEERKMTRQKRPREERLGEATNSAGSGRGRVAARCPVVVPLVRTPSFLQWKAVLQRPQQDAGSGSGIAAGDSLVSTTGATKANATALRPLGLPGRGGRCGKEARGSGASASDLVPGSVAKVPGLATQQPSSKHLSSPGPTTAATKRQRAAHPHGGETTTRARPGVASTAALTGACSAKQPQPVSLFTNLPPLQLNRRFTISNAEEEERRLHQFATALVEHGYMPAPSLAGKSITEVPTAHERAGAGEWESVGNPFSSTDTVGLAGVRRSSLGSPSSQKHKRPSATTSPQRSMSPTSAIQNGSASGPQSGAATTGATPLPPLLPPSPRSRTAQDPPSHR